ncbi:hypothetical protein [Lactobacillus crispatus]|uniref:hypothetical protein n=1 Tax=Lactobacillus crispatus TaxID=47770 RepID=UPI001E39CB73|nr:hypothetical protein [Lactobacillus crispatus]
MHKYETLPAERKLLKKYIKIQKAAPLNQISIDETSHQEVNSYEFKLLVEAELVEFMPSRYSYPSEFKVTDEGLNFFKWRWARFWNTLFKSILLPIFVSITTTLITTKLLSLIFH